jgi:hypothetical protein
MEPTFVKIKPIPFKEIHKGLFLTVQFWNDDRNGCKTSSEIGIVKSIAGKKITVTLLTNTILRVIYRFNFNVNTLPFVVRNHREVTYDYSISGHQHYSIVALCHLEKEIVTRLLDAQKTVLGNAVTEAQKQLDEFIVFQNQLTKTKKT